MRFVLFYHSLISDWNHGNAHFLRGIVRELQARGHQVDVYEPRNGWSLRNLRKSEGELAVRAIRQAFPELRSHFYDPHAIDLDVVLDGADVVIVHEWNLPEFIERVGAHRDAGGDYRLLFHDTHHRSVSDRTSLAGCDLQDYDGVLAFGQVLRDLYLERGWTGRAWTWHEAADTTLFRPLPCPVENRELVWIGNWGDGERTRELQEYLLEPVRELGIRGRVYGVRYPVSGLKALAAAGLEYRGWLPNHLAPEIYARHRVTVHVPRRHFREWLPGIPTIRVFEALACGIPLVCAPWDDVEGLFTPGRDYLVARNGAEITSHLRAILNDPHGLAAELARHGHKTILERHTCAHRVDELLAICAELGATPESARARRAWTESEARWSRRRSAASAVATFEEGGPP